jgi:hypothetical protein
MGESNCHDSCMVAYCQEVRKFEEKFDGFELHHIPRCDNEMDDAIGRLRSSHEQPSLGVFRQDLDKPSIRFDEDGLAPASGTLPDGGNSIMTLGTNLGTPPGPTS